MKLIALKTMKSRKDAAPLIHSRSTRSSSSGWQWQGWTVGKFSAHGLRSGFLTEVANRGIPLPEAMEQSRHRSVQQASSYYNNVTRRSGRATRML